MMLNSRAVTLQGGGDSCSRSRKLDQIELTELESDLLNAIAQVESGGCDEGLGDAK